MVPNHQQIRVFQSTHLLRGGTRGASSPRTTSKFQSTHLLRGGTERFCALGVGGANISIHPPPARWDDDLIAIAAALTGFQSTHLLRGGTDKPVDNRTAEEINFNPPTSCEVGLVRPAAVAVATVFQSTHLLRGGTWTDARV